MFNLHIGVQLKVSRFVANSEVALGHLGFGGVEGHLVTGEPTLVANHSSSVDGGTGKVKVNIAAQVDILALVGGFDLAALFPVEVKQWVSRQHFWEGDASTWDPTFLGEGKWDPRWIPLSLFYLIGQKTRLDCGP